MEFITLENIFYIAAIILGVYIALQIYIINKMRIIIRKLFDILFQFEDIMRRFKIPGKTKPGKIRKTCQICKYRLAFFNSKSNNPGFLYYRCQITRKKVPADFLCNDFVIDPQTYNV
ncbi:hypothetical protein H8E88_31525 [candidate division KSB1 bacterium]|nr:hypothetical protein [candidate division KSB1 bacterium]